MQKSLTQLKSSLTTITTLAAFVLLTSCVTSKKSLARKILVHPRISLLKTQVNGRSDGASAYQNVAAAAYGYKAKRSQHENAPGGYVSLDVKMLRALLYLADSEDYKFRVTSITGGAHHGRSRHYSGVAFDVDRINGVKVRSGTPYYKEFMLAARSRGATETLGPGDKGHSRHVHLAWPR